MSATTATAIRDAIQSAFRGKPVKRVELFGSAARGDLTPYSDVDILVTPSPEASRHDLNLERLWDTATQDIPSLREAIEKYLQSHT